MANTTTKTEDTATTRDDETSSAPKFYRVISSFPLDHERVLFRSISEKRARGWLERHIPRGEEAHLKLPDGTFESYVVERHGPHGEDMDSWQPFDPASWKPPAEQEPPGDSAWADVEG
jgi:hypothetical protein